MAINHVKGKNRGKVMLYALSTCGWCRRTRALLDELGVAYDLTDVDLLKGAAQQEAIDTIKKYNPACNFPTMVINDKKCIVGFQEDEIREALGGK